jgi:hypothetical protein
MELGPQAQEEVAEKCYHYKEDPEHSGTRKKAPDSIHQLVVL